MSTQSNGFMDEGYEVPKGSSDYMKFEKGENKFRILSKPITGWLDWQDKKPLRFRPSNRPTHPVDAAKPVRHFWAMIVWNHQAGKIQVLEITQKSVQAAILQLAKDSDWGNPFGYDIKVLKEGDGMETEYTVNPSPHKPASKEMLDAYKAKPCFLDALYDAKDPFGKENAEKSPLNDLML